MQHVLRGVSLYVGRDVADREMLHALADELGAKTALHPDGAVTHFVYVGVPQKSSEYHALVRKRSHDAPLLCVAPLWLTLCRDARRRVDESLATSAHDPLRTSLLAPADNAAEKSPVAGAKKRGSSRGTSATSVLRTKRLDIPRELPRTVRRTTTTTSTLALAAGPPPPPPPQLNLLDHDNNNNDHDDHDDDGFGGNATPMIIATTAPSTVDRDARLAQRIEGLLNVDEADEHEFAFDSYGDSMAFDTSVHHSLSQTAALPVSAVRPPPRRGDGAHDFGHDADTTSVAVAAIGGGGGGVGGGVGGGGGAQPTPQAVRYGLSADEKKRRDEVLARAKRRKMTVDDSKGVAVSHSAGKQNSVENLSDQLGVHVVVSNFTKSDATDILGPAAPALGGGRPRGDCATDDARRGVPAVAECQVSVRAGGGRVDSVAVLGRRVGARRLCD
jgi:hypothetical protein